VWLTTLWNQDLWAVQWGAALGASLAAAVTDIAWRRIPNILTGPLFLTGLAFAVWSGGWAGLAEGFLAAVLLAFPYILLFIFAGGGGGDAKLMGALGAWLGLINSGILLASVCICGIVLAFAFAISKGKFRETLENISLMLVCWTAAIRFGGKDAVLTAKAAPAVSGMTKIPYGVAILAGALVAAGGISIWRL
jgi:prepilin peptidase CpaA